MKAYPYRNCLGILLLALLLSGGCVRDRYDVPDPGGSSGKVVLVSLKVAIPPVVSPVAASSAPPVRSAAGADDNPLFSVCQEPSELQAATRASDGKTELYNLWLFQFNADGSINGSPHKITDKVTAVNDMVTLDVPLVVAANQTIYLLALGPMLDADLTTVSSVTDLESRSFSYITNKDGGSVSVITEESQIPFSGKVSGATVVDVDGGRRGLVEYNEPDGFSGGIQIRRLMAQVALRYKFEVPDYTLQGLKLLNANTALSLANPDANPDTDSYATLDGVMSDTPDADGFHTVTWYVAQNRKGTVTGIFSESDRYNKTEGSVQSGNAPALGTNIEAWAYSQKDTDAYAIYQMYVGKNNTNNFDVDANHAYNLRTTINADISSARDDGRIRSYTASMSVYLTAFRRIKTTSSTVSLGRTGTSYDYDAHCDMRPIIAQIHGRRLDIGIFTDEACTMSVSMGESWLHLSSSPNYTEAINNTASPLDVSATATAFLPSQLKFYLYSDEFIYDTDGKIPDPDVRRSLYVRFTTTTEGVSDGAVKTFSAVYHMRQQPAVYVGRFGGHEEGGQFTQGLVHDQIMEADNSYTAETKRPTTSKHYGYSGVPVNNYDMENVHSGKTATRFLAENPDGFDVGTGISNFIPMEKDAAGNILLYQYSYYDSFAARFCYDRNRDENGNGRIDDDELKWYLPASFQALGLMLGGDLNLLRNGFWTSTESTGTNSTQYNGGTGLGGGYLMNARKTTTASSVRCVRDIPMPAH